MTIFNEKRLTNRTFKLDIERMRQGWYSDKYFANITAMMRMLGETGYRFEGKHARGGTVFNGELMGDTEVEMQIFNRHKPETLIAGVDKALCMLRHCTGYFTQRGDFVNSWDQLEVEAVHDGVFTTYNGDPRDVQPVMRIRGVYHHFALLETPMLGIISRASRIATNVYNTLKASNGKPVLFFPARFDLHEVQAADGYAYGVAVQRYNMDTGRRVGSFVSTDAQGDWWGASGGGTIPHSVIACFFGDTTDATLRFAETQPPEIPRIALVDFENDCVGTATAVAKGMFERFISLKEEGKKDEAEKFRLGGVRLDTGGEMRDVSLEPLGDPALDLGVNPRLVVTVRKALNRAWEDWGLTERQAAEAREYCQQIKIVVTGGFTPERINRFELLGVPADIYGVGSSLMVNDKGTNTDFTADVVKVKAKDAWQEMAKVGRAAADNPDLTRIPVDYDAVPALCSDINK